MVVRIELTAARKQLPREVEECLSRLTFFEEHSLRCLLLDLGDRVSGMLVVENDRGSICYNASHARVRQRFTVAHETAHFLLHVKKNRRSQLFIDPFVIFRRDDNSATGSDREEVEANRFGAALLMPATLVLKEIKQNGLDLDDEDGLGFLAKRFRVSAVAMTYRLNTFGLLR